MGVGLINIAPDDLPFADVIGGEELPFRQGGVTLLKLNMKGPDRAVATSAEAASRARLSNRGDRVVVVEVGVLNIGRIVCVCAEAGKSWRW